MPGNMSVPVTIPSPLPGATAGELLDLIRSGRATTRGELGRVTGLSRTAVSARLASLASAGLVLEGEEESATGGRPASTLVLNRDAGLVLAVAIGRSRSQMSVCALDGTELASASHDQEVGLGPDVLMPVVADHLSRMLADLGARATRSAASGSPGRHRRSGARGQRGLARPWPAGTAYRSGHTSRTSPAHRWSSTTTAT